MRMPQRSTSSGKMLGMKICKMHAEVEKMISTSVVKMVQFVTTAALTAGGGTSHTHGLALALCAQDAMVWIAEVTLVLVTSSER